MARLTLARIGFAVAVAVTAWGSLAPARDVAFASGLWDKAQHALGYALLAGLLMAAQRRPRPLVAGVVVLAIGAVLEGLQALTPDRSADVIDLVANAIGIAVACGAVALWRIAGPGEPTVSPCRSAKMRG